MKYHKNQLQKYRQQPLTFDEVLDLETLAKQRFPEMILALSPLDVSGSITYLDEDDLMLHVDVKGTITVPSSRSLTPVNHTVNTVIDERYIENEAHLADFEETDAVFVLDNETINVDEAILDNIVAELPLQILAPEEMASDDLPAGNDWHVISEETYENEKNSEKQAELDPRLSKLDDFFK